MSDLSKVALEYLDDVRVLELLHWVIDQLGNDGNYILTSDLDFLIATKLEEQRNG